MAWLVKVLKDFLGFMFFQKISPSPWTTCFVLLVMVLDVRLQVIFPLRFSITRFVLLGDVFCFKLRLIFFFFSFVPLPNVFPLLINYFMNWN
jgi:hypothetical protein